MTIPNGLEKYFYPLLTAEQSYFSRAKPVQDNSAHPQRIVEADKTDTVHG